jgi:hypothetical protein
LHDFECPEQLKPRRPFHWAIEFPEVFWRDRPGFDAILGNPPFMGGQKLTGALGRSYREYLVRQLADGARGSADLAAYFLLRAHGLLRMAGDFGLLAVNTIAEGDTRQIGLERMVKNGATIFSAYPNEPWPGKAAVSISRVHVHKGEWHGSRSLLGQPAEHISAFLSEVREWTPKKLDANNGIAFIGSLVWGAGFTLKEDDALAMISRDTRNRDVLFPYLNGLDLNSVPDQRPSRWVVNFWDWQEDKARSYREPYQWILERVKPERMGLPDTTNDNRRRKKYWWLYGRDAKGLYHTIGRGGRFSEHPKSWDATRRQFQNIIGTTLTSKHRIFVLIPNDCVIDQTIVVFATEDLDLQGKLQSEIHLSWVLRQGGSLETRPRYIQTDCFETFPLPEKSPGDAATCMRKINVQRTEITTSNSFGLTELYNRFHSPSDSDERIVRLRQLHRELDITVADAYGWGDISLGHGFHRRPNLPKKDQIRFTISDEARAEVLARLSALNRDRHASESS